MCSRVFNAPLQALFFSVFNDHSDYGFMLFS